MTTGGNGYGTPQTFTSNDNIKWRVLSKENNEVVLISEEPLQTDDNKEFYLNGAIGYLYAEEELNKICSIYGHGVGANTSKTFSYEVGDVVEVVQKITLTGSGARSITVEDVNKICGVTPSTTLDSEYGKEYTKSINVQAIFEEEYGLDEFCKEAVKNLNARCVNYCYPVRLRKTFEYAKEHGYDTVTTTLLYSIYQKHDFIKKLMEQYSEEYGIDFLYRDFRVGFWEGHQKAHDLGLYMQKYCGCIFSEEDRYSKQIKRDKE